MHSRLPTSMLFLDLLDDLASEEHGDILELLEILVRKVMCDII
jgi:hypothetical protein